MIHRFQRFFVALSSALLLLTAQATHAVCTNNQECATAIYSPFPTTESPSYSTGHWVEDAITGDGAYASAGAFGFYPWASQ